MLQAACCVLLAAVLAAGAIGIYLEGSARKAENPLESIYTAETAARVLTAAAPLFLLSCGLLAACLLLGVKNPEPGRKAGEISPVKPKAEPRHKSLVQAVLIAAAAAFILAGILNGSALDVLAKAVNICTECVGLG